MLPESQYHIKGKGACEKLLSIVAQLIFYYKGRTKSFPVLYGKKKTWILNVFFKI